MTKDRKSFVRFIVRRQDLDSRTWEALAYEPRAMRSWRSMRPRCRNRLWPWFRMHLKVPYAFADTGNERALWFKATAQKPTGCAREPCVASP